MFDFALHFRCLQKATEAFFELGQASLAAGIAWQTRFNEELGNNPAAATVEPFALWQSWLECWVTPSAPPRSNEFTNLWQSWANPASTALVASVSAWPSFSANAFLNATPWSFYQGPLMAMMLSYGVPYSVAAPTARASTCAMDAADAACAQWRSMFAEETQSGGFGQQRRRLAYLH